MQKKTYKSINLACTLQQDDEITTDKCLNGVISKTDDGFRFEEAVRQGRPKRNPMLNETCAKQGLCAGRSFLSKWRKVKLIHQPDPNQDVFVKNY